MRRIPSPVASEPRSGLARLFAADPRRSAVGRLLSAVLASNDFIFLLARDDGLRASVLDEAAAEFANLRCRIVRVSAAPRGPGLSLPSLVAHILRQADPSDGQGDELERSHRLLTAAGESWDRIVLLVDHAHALDPNALRYIQLTSRASSNLRVVFAGEPEIGGEQSHPEFRSFRAKPFTCIALPDTLAVKRHAPQLGTENSRSLSSGRR